MLAPSYHVPPLATDHVAGRCMHDMLTTEEAADYLRVQPRTLGDWRYRGIGPRYVTYGRVVRYRRAALDSWLASRERGSTSDDAAASARSERERDDEHASTP